MKIKIFQATDGDCLLLESHNDTNILVDGGRGGSFLDNTFPELNALTQENRKLDLVYVSHIDNDHISGILKLTEYLVKWKVYDFQSQTNAQFPKPKHPRPPEVDHIWHNAFKDMLGELAAPAEDILVIAGQAFLVEGKHENALHTVENIITGFNEAVELNLRLKENLPGIKLNDPAEGDLIIRSPQLQEVDLKGLKIKILGPNQDSIDKLKNEWKKFLEDGKLRLEEIKEEIEEEGRRLGLSEEAILHKSITSFANQFEELGQGNITIPNIASLILLIEEGTGIGAKRILLTGDAGSEEIMEGLKFHELIDNDKGIHLDVLKIQHHGALANVTKDFCKTVTADHYIFCGNGAHHNPEIEVLGAIVDSRLGDMAEDSLSPVETDRKFRMWFSNSEDSANTEKRKAHMKAVEEKMKELKNQFKGGFDTRFIRQGTHHTFTV
jgi:beta-lactamase superfamily II metal-dependent hydrolase